MTNLKKKNVWFTAVLILFLSLSLGVNIHAASMTLSAKNLTLEAGKTKTLKVKGTKKKVTWKSSNSKVATVNKKGKISAKKAGTAKIYAKVSGKKLICKVTVISLNEKNLTLDSGKSYTLKVKGTKKTVTWSSSNANVATVSKKGAVTAKKEGTATIYAKVAKQKLKCKVTVNKTADITPSPSPSPSPSTTPTSDTTPTAEPTPLSPPSIF